MEEKGRKISFAICLKIKTYVSGIDDDLCKLNFKSEKSITCQLAKLIIYALLYKMRSVEFETSNLTVGKKK